MKKFYYVASILLAICLTSCSHDKKDPSPEITAAVGKFNFKIGSQSFEGQASAQITSNQIIIGGVVNSTKVSVIVLKSGAVGTYDVKGSPTGITPDGEVNYQTDASTIYSSLFSPTGLSLGTIKITEIDATNKTVSGTFSSTVLLLDGVTSVKLTDGSFNKIPYVLKAANTLTAKVNGTPFTATTTIGESQSGLIGIHAQTDSNGIKVITIAVNDDITTGTYKIGDLFSTINTTYTDFSDLSVFVSTEGTLTITSHDTQLKRIEGTLNFKTASIDGLTTGPAITEGAFAVSYQ